MKKILGVSIMAMLVVTPMMANAAQSVPAVASVTDAAASQTVDPAVATAGFVKGAYNAIQEEIRGIVGDIDVTTDGTIIKANKSVVENLQALETEVQGLSGNVGGITNAINQNAENADFTAGDSGLTSDTIGEAIQEVQGNVTTLSGTVDGLSDDVSDNASAIDALNGGANDNGSVANTVKTQAQNADFTPGDSGLASTDIGSAIKEVKGDADAAAAAVDTLAGRKITYVSSWTNPTVQTQTLGSLPQ